MGASDIIMTYLNSLGFTPDDVVIERRYLHDDSFVYKIPGLFRYLEEYNYLIIDKNEFNLIVRMFDKPEETWQTFRKYVGNLIGKDLSSSSIFFSILTKK